MKRKIIYLLVMICCLSVFTSAKQASYKCNKKVDCLMEGAALPQPVKTEEKNEIGFELSPLQLFVFNL
jgi:hypothetical protein